MNTSRSDRRARRGTLARTAGWLAAGAMLATAAFAPASVSAANPTSMDVACNNIVSGGRSPEYVWTTVGADGVTAGWAIDEAHFDAANQRTVTIRVCVVDADGDDHGAIDRNTENDGSQLFPWSVLGYAANPCPDSSLAFGSSADSPVVETKKSNLVSCTAAAPTDDTEPTDGVEPTDDTEPTDETDQPTGEIDEPTDAVNEPTDDTEPTDDAGGAPADPVDDSTPGGDVSTGAVKGIVGTPGVTVPPTDTNLVAPATPSSDGWRMVLVLMAAVLIGSLAVAQPRRARRTA